MTSADQLRLLAIAGSAAFTAILWILFRPRREVLRATLIPAALFAALDLFMEWAMVTFGIRVCFGSWQIFHVPVLGIVQHLVLGVGLCLLAAQFIKKFDIVFDALLIKGL